MNKSFNYRQKVIEATLHYQQLVTSMYSFGISLGMQTELKDLKGIFQPGDIIPYDLNLLEILENPMVKPLIKLIKTLESYVEILIRQNHFFSSEVKEKYQHMINAHALVSDPALTPLEIIAVLTHSSHKLIDMAMQLSFAREDTRNISPEDFKEVYQKLPDQISNYDLHAVCIHNSADDLMDCINQIKNLM